MIYRVTARQTRLPSSVRAKRPFPGHIACSTSLEKAAAGWHLARGGNLWFVEFQHLNRQS